MAIKNQEVLAKVARELKSKATQYKQHFGTDKEPTNDEKHVVIVELAKAKALTTGENYKDRLDGYEKYVDGLVRVYWDGKDDLDALITKHYDYEIVGHLDEDDVTTNIAAAW